MRYSFFKKNTAMTLAEILIVVALIAMVSVAIYNALVNGLKVWDRSRSLAMEEEIAVFFEKFTEDVRNGFTYSLISLEGSETQFAFPARILTTVDQKRRGQEEDAIFQIGKVEYYYDLTKDTLFKRSAVYGQAVNFQYGEPKVMLENVTDVKFRYGYLTESEVLYSLEVLDALPALVEVTVKFSGRGKERALSKTIDLPLGASL